jgi:hypothetical protein
LFILTLVSASCTPSRGDSTCAEIGDACNAESMTAIAGLLERSMLDECTAAADAGIVSSCSERKDACLLECAETETPATEAAIAGCWRNDDMDARLCMGDAHVQGTTNPHAYSWWSPADAASPAYSGEYETFENAGRPGVLILYNAPAGGMARCYRVLIGPQGMFTTSGVGSMGSCPNELGDYSTRWQREDQ